ncbi:glycoside hydrolase family 6 protein [Streptomyces marincola]|uniref:glycoside hydrolase family 6 protein n=1 Tax=Streptomyces marincola TaxID=2878388 RepID=UPI001CF538C9|nr:glycoside hydrolase family 6 protein [Streptomyces marincola]UCM90993.1 glycoside hydrolase family 6 protein [Streptomyces marincola]
MNARSTSGAGAARPARHPVRHRALVAVAGACAVAAGLLATGPANAAPPTAAARGGNPYEGASVYVDPEWSANAASVPGGAAVADQPTAVWLDSRAAVHGSGAGADRTMGLADHLDAALAQDADLVQLVLNNLPGRSCAREAGQGELTPGALERYRREYVDPIVDIIGDPAYAGLRIVAVIEPDSLPNLVLHTGNRYGATWMCEQVLESGSYVRGIGYALAQLGELPHVYTYLDAGHHARIGWDEDFMAVTRLMWEAASTEGARPADVHGFAVNVANYSVLREEYFTVDDVVHDRPALQSRWVDWNPYVDELPFAEAVRERFVRLGFDWDIGILVDTSRNGWGGPDRPAGPPDPDHPWQNIDDYVDSNRLDRRIHTAHWCNQTGAGLGERPVASPAPGIDAYAWIKPPGESDGSAVNLPGAGGRQPDAMCDTHDWYLRPTGALPGGGLAGDWFPEHFEQLLANAHPPL